MARYCSVPGWVKSDTVSPTARHRCDVSSELCCPDAKQRRWTPPLVTRFGAISRKWITKTVKIWFDFEVSSRNGIKTKQQPLRCKLLQRTKLPEWILPSGELCFKTWNKMFAKDTAFFWSHLITGQLIFFSNHLSDEKKGSSSHGFHY